MKNITYSGDFGDGTLYVRVDGVVVLAVGLVELQQDNTQFQADLHSHLVDAIEDSFKAGIEHERKRILTTLRALN